MRSYQWHHTVWLVRVMCYNYAHHIDYIRSTPDSTCTKQWKVGPSCLTVWLYTIYTHTHLNMCMYASAFTAIVFYTLGLPTISYTSIQGFTPFSNYTPTHPHALVTIHRKQETYWAKPLTHCVPITMLKVSGVGRAPSIEVNCIIQ